MRIKKAKYINEFGYSFHCENIKIQDDIIWSISVRNDFPCNLKETNDLSLDDEMSLIKKIKTDYASQGLDIFTQIEY